MTVRDPMLLVCKEVVELVSDFLSGALNAENRAAVEKHLLECTPCTTYFAQLRSLIGMLSALHRESPAEADPELPQLFGRWSGRAT